ncbi:MAG: peptide chain release factor N(5)-glutamine methyltransferase [Gammaproteobacteria bacterium]
MNIRDLLKQATRQLNTHSDSARLDAEVLLCYVLQKNRAYLLTWPEQELTDSQLGQFQQLCDARVTGQPVAHLTEEREFWSLPLKVTADTLIPRPDTELLVEQILQVCPEQAELKLLDLGTGSGAIAIALATEHPGWKIIATDFSEPALKVAQQNAQRLKLSNIEFRQGNWFEPLSGLSFDIIVSNPPYIPSNDPHLTQGDVRFEPLSALVSGAEGLDDIETICQQASDYLNPGGLLIVEHGYDQAEKIRPIFQKNGFTNINQGRDIAHNPRITYGYKI